MVSKGKYKMKIFLILLLLIPAGFINAQKIGEFAPDKPPEVFPPNVWGMDLMFAEGGFGLGTFYRRNFSLTTTGFVDFSISETKDEREIDYVDIFGKTYTPNAVNRSFQLPVNFGLQYRMFSETLTENFRPYIFIGVGPTFIITDPSDHEFFNAFRYSKLHYGAGGYIGFGANMGVSKSSLVGLNVRYFYSHVFDSGIENLTNEFRKDFGQFIISLNLGIMY
jgi:hypothetical protein